MITSNISAKTYERFEESSIVKVRHGSNNPVATHDLKGRQKNALHPV